MVPIQPEELERLPIFPLPNLVFFPHTLLPLHIFEPRYRKMTGDVIARSLPMAVVQIKEGATSDGSPAIRSVAGVGRVVKHKRLPDGRYYLVLQGLGRIRICEELVTDEPYRLVRAELLPDEVSPGAVHSVARLRSMLQVMTMSLSSSNPQLSAALSEMLSSAETPGELADSIGSALVADPEARQQLLETLAVEARLQTVVDAVTELLVASAPPPESGQYLN